MKQLKDLEGTDVMARDPLVNQFLSRSENAAAEAKRLYGAALRGLAKRILGRPRNSSIIRQTSSS